MKTLTIVLVVVLSAFMIWFNSTINTEPIEPIPKLQENTTETRKLLGEIQDNIDDMRETLEEQME